jgi:hypothetical protein
MPFPAGQHGNSNIPRPLTMPFSCSMQQPYPALPENCIPSRIRSGNLQNVCAKRSDRIAKTHVNNPYRPILSLSAENSPGWYGLTVPEPTLPVRIMRKDLSCAPWESGQSWYGDTIQRCVYQPWNWQEHAPLSAGMLCTSAQTLCTIHMYPTFQLNVGKRFVTLNPC